MRRSNGFGLFTLRVMENHYQHFKPVCPCFPARSTNMEMRGTSTSTDFRREERTRHSRWMEFKSNRESKQWETKAGGGEAELMRLETCRFILTACDPTSLRKQRRAGSFCPSSSLWLQIMILYRTTAAFRFAEFDPMLTKSPQIVIKPAVHPIRGDDLGEPSA